MKPPRVEAILLAATFVVLLFTVTIVIASIAVLLAIGTPR